MEKKLKKLTNFSGVKGPVVTLVMDGIGPVSYTHLDVYKRQVGDHAVKIAHILLGAGVGDIQHAVGAVLGKAAVLVLDLSLIHI